MYRPHRIILTLLGLALSLTAPAPLDAQGVTSGSLSGTVRDAAENTLDGASLVLQDEETGITRKIMTPHGGAFEFSFLPPSTYSLRVERLGFRPQALTGLAVRVDQNLHLQVALKPLAGDDGVDSVRVPGQHGSSLVPGLRIQVSRRALTAFPSQGREMTNAARLTSQVDEALGMQGLPAALAGVRVDGAPAGPLAGSAPTSGWFASPQIPQSAVEQVEIVLTSPDVEWSGYNSGSFDSFSRRGTREFQASAFGTWSNLAPQSGEGASTSASGSAQGGFTLSGPLVRDTASYALGFEAWYLDSSSRVHPQGSYGQALSIAREHFGVDLAPARRTEVVTGFGRLDWQLSATHALNLRTTVASLLSADGFTTAPPVLRNGRPYTGLDASSAFTLTSTLAPRVASELRLTADYNRRALDTTGPGELTAATRIVGTGLAFGPEGSAAGALTQTSGRISEVVYARNGDHRFKFGAVAGVSLLDHSYAQRPATFFFSGLSDFAATRGYFVAPARTTTTASYTLPELSLFAQDSWTAGSGLNLLLGARVDAGWLPIDKVGPNKDLLAVTGLVNVNVEPRWMRFSPRAGFVWDVQNRNQLIVNGSLGMYSGHIDVAELGEFVANADGVSVQRGYGTLDEWPGVPESSAVGTTGTSLTLLAPRFAPAQSLRSSLSISRSLGRNTSVQLAALHRYTTGLPRRTNLNLVTAPAAVDQYGRAVYARLEKQGAILFPVRDSNRRFAGYDGIYAVNVDGWSGYSGLSFELQHQPDRGVRWFGSYTYSQTTDNQPAATTVAELGLAPTLRDSAQWVDGRSGLDVPHRASVGLVLPLPGLRGSEIATLYRYRSGLPFTPGLAIGVDANGDGVSGNDPAFVDSEIPGMDELVAHWSCLGGQIGRMAARNSCRTAGLHSLDLRLGLSFVRIGRYSTQLVVDGLNLLSSRVIFPDGALYRLDESRSLSSDRAKGTVNVPLVVNENFGNPLVRLQDGRILRVGLRVNY